jgi:hypothetical protein
VSDLKTSLLRSLGFKTSKVIFVALSDIPPPYFISVDLCPQNSQEKAMMIISLK